MRFNVLQQDFLPSIQAVARCVGTRSTLPVLDNILLSTDGTRLKIAATNLEIGIIKHINVEIIEPGETTVPAKTIVELVSGLKQTKLEIESDVNSLTLSAGKFKAVINGIPATEFPVIPLSEAGGVSFKKEVLQSCSQILFASAVDEGRPQLTGVLTQANGGKLDFVATDGFRLAHRQVSLPGGVEGFKSLIPRRTFEEVLKVLAEESVDEVKISTSQNQNQAIFDFGATTISSRLIEGAFPAWEKIIPTTSVARAMLDKDSLLGAIKLAAIFAKNEANVVVLKTLEGKVTLESSAKELGSQQNEVEGQVEGESLQIAFNARFLLDAVTNCPSTQLTLDFSGPLSPTLIKPMGVEGLEYIVMPVRLN